MYASTSSLPGAGGGLLLECRQADFGIPLPAPCRPLDWVIRAGEQWAVCGPSGCGKSVLINGILKKIPLVSGRILYYFDTDNGTGRGFYNKTDVIRVSTRDFGFSGTGVSGFYQARWHSMQESDMPTAGDYLQPETVHRISPFEVNSSPEPTTTVSRSMRPIIDLLGIQNLMERRVHHLSHGELRKVLIARALIQRPKLLILEDPFAGLDTGFRTRFHRVLEMLLTAGEVQMLLTTARPEDIPDGITHVLDMHKGQRVYLAGKAKPFVSMAGDSLSTPDILAESDFQDIPKNANHPPVIIDIKNTSVHYGGISILHHINWQVRKKERWAVLGPNGAGKSTLLSLILADNPQAYANDITLFGRKRGTGETIWEIKRPIGWMSPELQIYYKKEISCLDVVCSGFFDSIGLYAVCSSEQVEMAKQWMAELKIAHLETELFPRMSESAQRLVLLARALVKSPKLLVLDEPCQGLDRETRHGIIRLIDQICRRTNTPLLYVTHDLDELPDVITHVLTLDAGRITGCGPREKTLESAGA